MGVSLNGGTPKSSILIGISIINHPFWGTTTIQFTGGYFKLDELVGTESSVENFPEVSVKVEDLIGPSEARWLGKLVGVVPPKDWWPSWHVKKGSSWVFLGNKSVKPSFLESFFFGWWKILKI